MTPLFDLGQVNLTPLAAELPHELIELWIARHVCGDWGELPQADKDLNQNSLLMPMGRVISRYLTEEMSWLVITERLNTAVVRTTVMGSIEY